MIDQTRSHRNNAEHAKTVFMNLMRPLPAEIRRETVHAMLQELSVQDPELHHQYKAASLALENS